ncbi:hypothetical protein GE061_017476 [Apolygus lucorum]|uniref:Uncharacterized protein n=1 Tax=Apolygus lucorum TaxID=248454 RepID=A0A8S9XB70_APOLU|nr:hypothetical protein GE061_017476 [Apolygus lucorum]
MGSVRSGGLRIPPLPPPPPPSPPPKRITRCCSWIVNSRSRCSSQHHPVVDTINNEGETLKTYKKDELAPGFVFHCIQLLRNLESRLKQSNHDLQRFDDSLQ